MVLGSNKQLGVEKAGLSSRGCHAEVLQLHPSGRAAGEGGKRQGSLAGRQGVWA